MQYKVSGVIAYKHINRQFETEGDARCYVYKILTNFLKYFNRSLKSKMEVSYKPTDTKVLLFEYDLMDLDGVYYLIEELYDMDVFGSGFVLHLVCDFNGRVTYLG